MVARIYAYNVPPNEPQRRAIARRSSELLLKTVTDYICLLFSLSFVAALIGENVESGAFVYGCMSLVGMFANGITIEAIQSFLPVHQDQELDSPEERSVKLAYKSALVLPCLAASILGLIVLGSLIHVKIGTRQRSKTKEVESPDFVKTSRKEIVIVE